MGSFGERMQREREMRGITLEEIAESTKITTRSLKALEEEDFDKLPGGIFNKGFVRAYARYLGLDEEQAVADFVSAAGIRELPLPSSAPPESATDSEGPERVNWRGVLTFGLLLVLAAAMVWKLAPPARRLADRAWLAAQARLKSRHLPAQPPITFAAKPAAQPPAVALRQSDPAATSDNPSPVQSANAVIATSDGFVVLIRAKEDSWVSISSDGKPLTEGTLSAATEKQVRAKSQVVLKTRNAAAMEVSYNGKPLPPLGGENEVTTVIFTPQGVQR